MGSLGFFLAGALVGAACVRYSRNKALIAADNERARSENQIQSLTNERNGYQNHLIEIRIEQANNAGYIDGYNACRRDMEAEQEAGIASELLTQSLRDGKRITCAILGR